MRLHVVLNLAAELELAPDALLLDGGTLMALDVLGHLIERRRQRADLVAAAHLDARAVVAVRDALHALRERRKISREPRRQRHHEGERHPDEQQAERRVAASRLTQRPERIAGRPCNAEPQA